MAQAARSRLLLVSLVLLSWRADAGGWSLGPVFERAMAKASEKLESPACHAVLGDFHDAAGRTLDRRLAETGLSAPEFLARLEFRSGRYEDTCQRSHVDAFTIVGGSMVWVCPRGSLELGSADLANVLIHEMLHALGLPENPPTPLEITRRVSDRCGR